jgi:hypothetical protein
MKHVVPLIITTEAVLIQPSQEGKTLQLKHIPWKFSKSQSGSASSKPLVHAKWIVL